MPPSFAEPEETSQQESIRPITGQTIKIGISADTRTLDSQKAFDLGGMLVSFAVSEPLYRVDGEQNVVPIIASSLPKKIDSNTFVIPLREKVSFHDGSPLTADDVRFTLQRLQNAALQLPTGMLYKCISAISLSQEGEIEIKTSADRTRLVHLLSRPESVILSKRRVSHLGSAYGTAGVLGSGPFSLKDWSKGQSIILEKHPSYWASNPDALRLLSQAAEVSQEKNISSHVADSHDIPTSHISEEGGEVDTSGVKQPSLPYPGKIKISIIPDRKTLAGRLRIQLIDIALDIDTETYENCLKKPEKYSLQHFPGQRVVQLYINQKTGPFDQKLFRKALSWSINRRKLIENVFKGHADAATCHLLPGLTSFTVPQPIRSAFEYKPEKVRALLSANGYSDNTPLSFTCIFSSTPRIKAVAGELGKQWSSLGFRVIMREMPPGKLIQLLYAKKQEKQTDSQVTWHVALEDWYEWRHMDDPMEYLATQCATDSPYNKGEYSNATLDRLFSAPYEQRANYISRALTILAEDMPFIPLVSPHYLVAWLKRLQGLQWTTGGIPLLEKCWVQSNQ